MSNEQIILEGKDYDKMIAEGMRKLGISKNDLNIEVLENKKTLFSNYFKIKFSVKEKKENYENLEKQLDQIIDMDNNACYQLKKVDFIYNEDGVYVEFNEKATLLDIEEKIKIKKIQDVDIEELKKAIGNRDYSKAVKIANKQEETIVDCKCQIKISKDLMQAFIYVTPPLGGAEISECAVSDFLRDSRIKFGVKTDEIKRLVDNKLYEQDILVAEGMAPQPGKDAVVDYHFDTSTTKNFKVDSEGKIDFHEMSIAKNVHKGMLLVTMIPETKGTAGKNILGLDIPAKDGKKLALPKGRYVDIGEDGNTLYASIDGEVKIVDGKVNVFSIFEVKADVDNSVGNIRFLGKVLVNGSVLTGFEIEAEGDVEVYGVVEGAKITSKGNVILHRGIQGSNRGEIYCDGDLIAKFIENSYVEAKGNITSDAIMHSNIVCGKKLEATGKKGLLVGGSFKVADDIKAKTIGSPMATVTEIEVGVSPDQRRKYDALKQELKQAVENLEKTSQAVDLLTKISKKGELPEDKKILLSKSTQLKLQLMKKIEEINKDMTELELLFEEVTKSKIRVYDAVYPGTRVIIGSSVMHIKDPLKYLTLYRANAEIKIGTYED